MMAATIVSGIEPRSPLDRLDVRMFVPLVITTPRRC
jgi:hypothetical protein